MKIQCKVKGCKKGGRIVKDFCLNHYQLWKRNGTPHSELSKKRGNGFVNEYGYKIICVNGKIIREHRYVMEQHLGRKLNSWEHIHHIDGNKLNNKIKNLLLVSNFNHMQFHVKKWHKQKPCTKCRKTKPLNQFNYRLTKNNKRRFYDSWCNACNVAAKRKRRHCKQRLGLPYS